MVQKDNAGIILELFESRMNEKVTSVYCDVLSQMNDICTKILNESFKETMKYEITELKRHLEHQMNNTELISDVSVKEENKDEFEPTDIVVSPSTTVILEHPDDVSLIENTGEKRKRRNNDIQPIPERNCLPFRKRTKNEISEKYKSYMRIEGSARNRKGKVINFGRCGICNKRYENSDSIKRHIRKEHGEVFKIEDQSNLDTILSNIAESPLSPEIEIERNERVSLVLTNNVEKKIKDKIDTKHSSRDSVSALENMSPKEIVKKLNSYIEITRRTKSNQGRTESFGRCKICTEKTGRTDSLRRHIKLIHFQSLQTQGFNKIDLCDSNIQENHTANNSLFQNIKILNENEGTDNIAKYISSTGYSYNTSRCKICFRTGSAINVRSHIKKVHKIGINSRPSIYSHLIEKCDKWIKCKDNKLMRLRRCKICNYETYYNISRHLRALHPKLLIK